MRLVAALVACLIAGPAAAAPAYKAPRNALGQPDLQGVWNSNWILPLEAVPGGPPLVLPEKEAAEYGRKVAAEAGAVKALALDPEVAEIAERLAKNGLAIVRGQRRTRQVVQPADGMMPMRPGPRNQVRFVENTIRNSADLPLGENNPEDRPNWERCIVGQGQPPITTTNEMNPRQILQTRDAVIVLTEYGPDLRIIPFTDTHGPAVRNTPTGDSIARWDGDTLVIETVRLPARDTIRPFPVLLVPPSAKVIERYTRLSEKELLYQFTVEDPAIYSAPWLAEYSIYRQDHPLYEFACHEGNYSLPNILAGARQREKETAEQRTRP